jgi:hypothetical protein
VKTNKSKQCGELKKKRKEKPGIGLYVTNEASSTLHVLYEKPPKLRPFGCFFEELLKKHPKWVVLGAFLHPK